MYMKYRLNLYSSLQLQPEKFHFHGSTWCVRRQVKNWPPTRGSRSWKCREKMLLIAPTKFYRPERRILFLGTYYSWNLLRRKKYSFVFRSSPSGAWNLLVRVEIYYPVCWYCIRFFVLKFKLKEKILPAQKISLVTPSMLLLALLSSSNSKLIFHLLSLRIHGI